MRTGKKPGAGARHLATNRRLNRSTGVVGTAYREGDLSDRVISSLTTSGTRREGEACLAPTRPLCRGLACPTLPRRGTNLPVKTLAPKESDPRRALLLGRQRAEELEDQGRRFRSILEREFCWYVEAYDLLKGRSRVLALADYSTEWPFVLAVPHHFLIGEPEQIVAEPVPAPQKVARKRRRQPDCPF